jgi:hypothetical protein
MAGGEKPTAESKEVCVTETTDDPQANLRQALKSAISHAKIQRSKGRTGKSVAKLAGAKKPKKAKGPKLSTRRRMGEQLTVSEQGEVDNLVNPFAQQHGHYEPSDFTLQEVTEGGKRKEKTLRVVMNRGGTTVERWHRAGKLDDRQMTAIAIYEGAWRRHIGEPRVVANWSAVIVRQATAALELRAASQHDARQLLRLFDQDIFFRRGLDDFNVWQNVVIFDEPAGVAGSRLGFASQQAQAVACFVIQSVAHEIAQLVVDQNPPDLEALLLDIDRPRKPRRIAT